MLTLPELKRTAAKDGVPQGIVEKDYALSVALNALAESPLHERIIFKGGTAIRKIYFPEARFSEDLDYTAPDTTAREIVRLLKEAMGGRTLEGVAFAEIEEEGTSAGLKASVKYAGPAKHQQRIRFDFSFRNNLVGKPAEKQLIGFYGLKGGRVLALELEEIFAEKVHALGSRSAPRDLYDVWYLLKKGVKPDPNIIDRKFSYYSEQYDTATIEANIDAAEKEWARDLKPLMKDLSNFANVKNKVRKELP